MLRRVWLVLAVLALGLVLVTASLASGCGRLKKKLDCKEFSIRICDKWFECWPVASESYWVDENDCRQIVEAACNKPEDLEGCHVDGDDLSDCNDGIEGSRCGLLPTSCTEMVDCLVE